MFRFKWITDYCIDKIEQVESILKRLTMAPLEEITKEKREEDEKKGEREEGREEENEDERHSTEGHLAWLNLPQTRRPGTVSNGHRRVKLSF